MSRVIFIQQFQFTECSKFRGILNPSRQITLKNLNIVSKYLSKLHLLKVIIYKIEIDHGLLMHISINTFSINYHPIMW